MRHVYLMIIILACQWSNAQHDTTHIKPHRLISVDAYKARVKRELTKQDSLLFITFDNRTMVRVDDQTDMSKSMPFEYRDSTFLELYKTVVFNPSRKNSDGKVFHKYWKQPLKIYVSSSIPRGSRKFLQQLAADITKDVDSLKITFVADLNDANFVVYSHGDFEYETNIRKKSDMYLYWNGRNQIYKAYIKLDQVAAFNENLLNLLIRDYFITTLGYFTLTDKINCANLFANCYSPDKQLSPLDKEIIKYHYSYGICKGVDLETFEGLHKKAQEHKKSKTKTIFRVLHTD